MCISIYVEIYIHNVHTHTYIYIYTPTVHIHSWRCILFALKDGQMRDLWLSCALGRKGAVEFFRSRSQTQGLLLKGLYS